MSHQIITLHKSMQSTSLTGKAITKTKHYQSVPNVSGQ